MQVGKKGLELIKHFEGLRLTSYRCSSNIPTVGYGHTGPDVHDGLVITEERAEELLKEDLHTAEKCVDTYAQVKLNQNEFDSLCSFVFNCGCGAFRDSTLLRYLNDGREKVEVADQLLRWNKGAGGVPVEGLTRRREAERKLFLEKPEFRHPLLGQSILAKQDTWLKKRPADSSTLKPEEKLFVPEGAAWEWSSITMFAGESHREVRLAAQPDKNWFFYEPHWEVLNDVPTNVVKPVPPSGEIKLDVPYYSQRDNYRDANRTCFSSSCAMLLSGLKPDAISGDDDYLHTVFDIGDTTEAWVQCKALESYGVKAEFVQNAGWETIEELLSQGIPCPLGILHHGSVSQPSGGGHWICAVGITADKQSIIVHDPWGDLDLVSGVYISTDGKFLNYSKKNLGPRWLVEGPTSGWIIKAQK